MIKKYTTLLNEAKENNITLDTKKNENEEAPKSVERILAVILRHSCKGVLKMKVVAYARFSSDNQRDESIDAQLRVIHKYAEKKGFNIVAEYTGRAKSATTDNREAFQQMIIDPELGNSDGVIIQIFYATKYCRY